jgi:hypothetical protein
MYYNASPNADIAVKAIEAYDTAAGISRQMILTIVSINGSNEWLVKCFVCQQQIRRPGLP